MKKAKHPIFQSILQSYLIICTIILAVTAAGYFYCYHIIREKVYAYAGQQSDIVANQVEEQIVGLQKVLGILAGSSLLKSIGKMDEADYAKHVLDWNKLKEELGYGLMQNKCTDIMEYNFKSHSLVGGKSRRYSSPTFALFLNQYNLSVEEFNDIVEYDGVNASHIFKDGRVWIMRTLFDDFQKRTVVLIAELEGEKLFTVLGDDAKSNALILSSENQIICNLSSIPNEDYLKVRDSLEGYKHIKIDKNYYYTVTRTVPSVKWQCFVATSDKEINQELRFYWYALLIEIIGVLGIAACLSWNFAKKTYKPVSGLMELLNSNKGRQYKETYDSLMDGLRGLLDERNNMESKISEAAKQVINKQVRQVLQGNITDPLLIETTMKKWIGMSADESWAMVLIKLSEEFRELFKYDQYSPYNENGTDLEMFVLKNITDELIFSYHKGNVTVHDEYYAAVINISKEHTYEELKEKLIRMINFYKSAMGMPVNIMLGEERKGFETLAKDYADLKDEMEYNLFWAQDNYNGQLWMNHGSSKKGAEPEFTDYLESTRKLMNCLESGDYASAYGILEYIYENTFPKDKRYLKYSIYRMYGLIGTLIMTLDISRNKEDREFFENLHYEEKLFQVRTVSQLMNVSKAIFEAVIHYNEQKAQEEFNGWINKVLAYIEENIADVNLSVSQIADYIGISVPHLSRTFKAAMNCGVLEYIHKLKLEKAKILLKSGLNIKEASEKAGFLDTKALTRVFKKYEGISPGKFKKL